MRFASLGSGSRGNAMLIEAGSTRLLLDNGFAMRELEKRLLRIGVDPDSIQAVLVTHEHQDHIRGVGAFARRYQLPVWMTSGTHCQDRCGQLPKVELINPHLKSFRIGDFEIEPFPVPHDAREPAQFVFCANGLRFGVLTDMGIYTQYILEKLQQCDALFLEFNHDNDMLANGPYPPPLRRRVGGNLGHLSNAQACSILKELDRAQLQQLVAAHLSEKNNRPQLVRESILEIDASLEERLTIAVQDDVSDLLEIC